MVPVVCAAAAAVADGSARLDGTRLDVMALLFLFAVILVLCVLASCLEDEQAGAVARAYEERYEERDGSQERQGYDERAPAGPRPPRCARARSPIWRLEAAQRREEGE
jgi:hypothetical protein